MIPKEKAKELFLKFRDEEMDVWDGEWAKYDQYCLTPQTSKACALICVGEVIKQIKKMGIEYPLEFWQEVQKEIENYELP